MSPLTSSAAFRVRADGSREDTRATPLAPYEPPPLRTPSVEEFREAWQEYRVRVDDLVVARTDLVFFPQDAATAVLLGTLRAPLPLREYLEGRGRSEDHTLEDGVAWDDVYGGDRILAASRTVGQGRQILLTREGYRRLAEGDLVIVREERLLGRESAPERLALAWSAAEVRP